LGSWYKRRESHQLRTTFILKNVVNKMNSNEAEAFSQRGLDQLASGSAADAVQSFRAAMTVDPSHIEAHHGLIRALRDAGRLEQSIGAALALTALTPNDPLAHTALSISLQRAGHIPEAEAAAARARILEWKAELQSSPDKDERQ
jgi:Flp pilus assembly protein TadD